jgi:hypothetical protein
MDNDKINPAHYRNGFPRKPVECIEVAEHLPFCLGNAIKYIWRAGKKPGEDWRDDLDKARWYLERQSRIPKYPGGLNDALKELERVDITGLYAATERVKFEAILKILRNEDPWDEKIGKEEITRLWLALESRETQNESSNQEKITND